MKRQENIYIINALLCDRSANSTVVTNSQLICLAVSEDEAKGAFITQTDKKYPAKNDNGFKQWERIGPIKIEKIEDLLVFKAARDIPKNTKNQLRQNIKNKIAGKIAGGTA
jgi:hypothetical protein